MLTLTYQENMTDRARMARDFDVFMKRIRRIFPAFEYVCVFEEQQRGAWHAHIAVKRVLSHYLHKGALVKSYDLLRAVWRAVVGKGNVDVSRARRHSQRNISKLASYLTKYLTKTFEDGGAGDSYRASGKALPKPVVVRSSVTDAGAAAIELIGLLFAFYKVRAFHPLTSTAGLLHSAVSLGGIGGVAPDDDDGLGQSIPRRGQGIVFSAWRIGKLSNKVDSRLINKGFLGLCRWRRGRSSA